MYASAQYVNIVSMNQKLGNSREIKKELGEIPGLMKCLEISSTFYKGLK